MTYRIKNELQSELEFQATYKGYSVHVKWEGAGEGPDLDESDFVDDDGEFDVEGWWDFEAKRDAVNDGPEDGMAWYITVGPVGTCYGSLYEGWWGNADDTLEEAVEEALIGSTLITEAQRKFGKVAA